MLSNADLVVILKRMANHSSLTALKHLFKQKSNVISANRHSITLNAKSNSNGTFINELSRELESWLCSFALMNVSVRVMNSIRCHSSLPEKLVFKRNESTAWVPRM